MSSTNAFNLSIIIKMFLYEFCSLLLYWALPICMTNAGQGLGIKYLNSWHIHSETFNPTVATAVCLGAINHVLCLANRQISSKFLLLDQLRTYIKTCCLINHQRKWRQQLSVDSDRSFNSKRVCGQQLLEYRNTSFKSIEAAEYIRN